MTYNLLPPDVISLIVDFSNPYDYPSLSLVDKSWNRIVGSQLIHTELLRVLTFELEGNVEAIITNFSYGLGALMDKGSLHVAQGVSLIFLDLFPHGWQSLSSGYGAQPCSSLMLLSTSTLFDSGVYHFRVRKQLDKLYQESIDVSQLSIATQYAMAFDPEKNLFDLLKLQNSTSIKKNLSPSLVF